jgi:AcrR family transcriptional regulator
MAAEVEDGTPPRPVRRTQEERRNASRASIAEATLASLAANGYTGTTIAGVAGAAGVSRGLMLHYYPQKEDLIVGVIGDAVQAAVDGLGARVDALPRGRKRVVAALDFVHDAFFSELSQAVLAVQVAARANSELRRRVDPIWALVPARVEELAPALFGADIAVTRDLPLLVGMIVATVRGVATTEAGDDRLWRFTRTQLALILEQRRAGEPRRSRGRQVLSRVD